MCVCTGEITVRVINSIIFQIPKIQSKYNHLVNFHYCACENMWRQETDVGLSSSITSPLNFWDKFSHWTWSMSFKLSWRARESSGSTCLHPPSARVTDICVYAWLLCGYWVQKSSWLALHSKHFTHWAITQASILRQSLTKLPKECSYLWSYFSVPSRWDYRHSF